MTTVDGAGFLIGDEGGGFWLGRHALRAALAAADGRGPATALGDLVAARFGPLDGLAARVHAGPDPVDRIAHAALDVFAAANAGDAVAGELVDTAATRLTRTVAAAAAGIDAPAPLALDGRVLSGDSPLASTACRPPPDRVRTAPIDRSSTGLRTARGNRIGDVTDRSGAVPAVDHDGSGGPHRAGRRIHVVDRLRRRGRPLPRRSDVGAEQHPRQRTHLARRWQPTAWPTRSPVVGSCTCSAQATRTSWPRRSSTAPEVSPPSTRSSFRR